MKYKLSLVKIHMIGSPALVLGFCRYDEDDAFWVKFQLFTMEEYLNCQYNYNPDNEWGLFRDQESADIAAEAMRHSARKFSKYHRDVVHFDSINKDIKVSQQSHDFNFDEAECVELVKGDWELLRHELIRDGWSEFDLETWGK